MVNKQLLSFSCSTHIQPHAVPAEPEGKLSCSWPSWPVQICGWKGRWLKPAFYTCAYIQMNNFHISIFTTTVSLCHFSRGCTSNAPGWTSTLKFSTVNLSASRAAEWMNCSICLDTSFSRNTSDSSSSAETKTVSLDVIPDHWTKKKFPWQFGTIHSESGLIAVYMIQLSENRILSK